MISLDAITTMSPLVPEPGYELSQLEPVLVQLPDVPQFPEVTLDVKVQAAAIAGKAGRAASAIRTIMMTAIYLAVDW
jgi:hypothetical protein